MVAIALGAVVLEAVGAAVVVAPLAAPRHVFTADTATANVARHARCSRHSGVGGVSRPPANNDAPQSVPLGAEARQFMGSQVRVVAP